MYLSICVVFSVAEIIYSAIFYSTYKQLALSYLLSNIKL